MLDVGGTRRKWKRFRDVTRKGIRCEKDEELGVGFNIAEERKDASTWSVFFMYC